MSRDHGELHRNEIWSAVRNDGRQYASGGMPGREMAEPEPAEPSSLKDNSAELDDRLMIQLSSFEGRTG